MIFSDDAVSQALLVLNRALAADPDAIRSLIFRRVPCNEALADDPTIQVCRAGDDESHPDTCAVGMLGIINGILGTYPADSCCAGAGPIAAVVDDDGMLSGFQRTDSFGSSAP